MIGQSESAEPELLTCPKGCRALWIAVPADQHRSVNGYDCSVSEDVNQLMGHVISQSDRLISFSEVLQ